MSGDNWSVIAAILLAVAILIFVVLRSLRGWPKAAGNARPGYGSELSAQVMTMAEPDDLQVSAKAVAMVLSEIDDGVVLTRNGYEVQYLNKAAERILEVTADKWSGLTFIEVARDHECYDVLRLCVETGQKQVSMVKTRQGGRLLNVMALPGPGEAQYVVIIEDFTERQRIEEIRKDLVSNVAHELRTPITSIRLLVETLLDGAISDPRVSTDFLRKVDIESAKLQQMADDLSKLSRIESSGAVLERGATDVGELVARTVERLSAQASRKSINVDIRVEAGLLNVLIDAAGVESVVVNLLHNAIKYTGSGGHVGVSALLNDDAVLVCVEDTGIGIPVGELPRIFERFYKVDKSRNSEGSGLGLAISKHIISAHGGRIWAESVEGKGSKFCFTLPLNA